MLTALTQLDAINIILSSIGSDPVNQIDTEVDIDVANALRLLEYHSRNLQRQGWDFNTLQETYSPDVLTHKILWDNTLLKWKSLDGNTYAKRGNYLYDMTNNTNVFEKDVELQVIKAVEFEDLPDCFRVYLAAQTALAFQTRYFGDANMSKDLQMEMSMAYQDIVNYDLQMQDANMLNLTGVSEVLQRT